MKYIFSLILVLSCLISSGQSWQASAEVIYCTFTMTDLKNLQQGLIDNSGISLQKVTQFPANFGLGGVVSGQTSNLIYGIHGGATSTGARADYEDYSGIARIDQLAKCFWFGAHFFFVMNKSSKWPLSFGVRQSIVFTDLNIKSYLQVGSSSQTDQASFTSKNIALRPELSIRRILKKIFLQASVGYELNVPGKLVLSTNSNAYLQTSSGDQAHAQWEGIRLSLGVGIYLVQAKNSD